MAKDTIYFNIFDAATCVEFNMIACFEQALNSRLFTAGMLSVYVPISLLRFFLFGPDAQLHLKERTILKNFWMLYSSTVSYCPGFLMFFSQFLLFIYAGFMLLKSSLHWNTYTCLVLYIEI